MKNVACGLLFVLCGCLFSKYALAIDKIEMGASLDSASLGCQIARDQALIAKAAYEQKAAAFSRYASLTREFINSLSGPSEADKIAAHGHKDSASANQTSAIAKNALAHENYNEAESHYCQASMYHFDFQTTQDDWFTPGLEAECFYASSKGHYISAKNNWVAAYGLMVQAEVLMELVVGLLSI